MQWLPVASVASESAGVATKEVCTTALDGVVSVQQACPRQLGECLRVLPQIVPTKVDLYLRYSDPVEDSVVMVVAAALGLGLGMAGGIMVRLVSSYSSVTIPDR